MLLDAGNLFVSKSKSSCDQVELGKAEQILRSYQSMAYDAINLSQEDLLFGTSFLLKDLLEEARALKLPLISSNLVSRKTEKPIFSPFIVKKAGEINVGIFGLMEHSSLTQKPDSTYIVKDPYEVAREMISSLKDKVGLIIALSSLSKEKNLKLPEDAPGIDFIISTDKRTHSPIRVKNSYILSSADKGKYLGRLDITLTSLERPLTLQDVSATRKLRSRLAWVQQKIISLKERENDVLGSDNARIKERYNKEIERLKKQEGQYRQEVAKLDKVSNSFTNAIIPLAAKRPEKAPKKLSLRHTGKTGAKGASPVMSPGPHIRINKLLADKGQRITFVLTIDKAPNQVRALGFDVVYDPKVLKYSKYVKGELVKKFDMFDASKIKDGQVRVGGFEARDDLIMAGKSGELVRLEFQVTGKGNSGLQLVRLKDDISLWGVESAQTSRQKNMEN